MRVTTFFFACVAGTGGCNIEEPLAFPPSDVPCDETFHGALPDEPAFERPPRFYGTSGSQPKEDRYGVLTMDDPYMADGLSRLQIGGDGDYTSLDFEGTSGVANVYQDDFTFTDDQLVGFYDFSHWCADGTYIGQATNPLGSVTLFARFRKAEEGEIWTRFPLPEDPDVPTSFQAMDVSLYEDAYSSGKDHAWHDEHRNRISSGTLIRRR